MRQLNLNINTSVGGQSNIVDVLLDNIQQNDYRFSKAGGTVKSVRQHYVQTLNKERNRILKPLKEKNPDAKLTQYAALAMLCGDGDERVSDIVLYKFVDTLATILPGVKGRPSLDDAKACFSYLAEDWANHPQNEYIDWDKLSVAVSDDAVIDEA